MRNEKKVQICAQSLKSLLPRHFVPKIGIVLGTGLGKLASSLEDSSSVPYEKIPDFPCSRAPSHRGAFVAGTLSGVPVLLQQGRCHLYEGWTAREVCVGIRVMARLGIGGLVLTNAAGAINPQFRAGSLMLVEDQINHTGQSPLTGPGSEDNESGESGEPRFPDMSRLYDRELLEIAARSGLALGIRLERGVYFCIPGPQLETRAETRAYRLLGGDAVGMSTAMEAIAAKDAGLRVLGVSCLTNKNLPDCMEETGIEEIIRVAEACGEDLTRLLVAALPALAAALP